MSYMLMLILMTLTLMQGHSESAKACSQRCMLSATKQAISLKLATTVGHFLSDRDLDLASVYMVCPACCFSCYDSLSLEHILIFRSDLTDMEKSTLMLICWRCCSKRFRRMSCSIFWKRWIFFISSTFLIRNIHLFLIFNCLIIWMNDWILIRLFNLMWCR